jgi:hypothetical protein
MYAKIKNNQLDKYPYEYTDFQNENPYTAFSGLDLYSAFQGTEENINGAELVEVQQEQAPSYNKKTQKVVVATTPTFNGSAWVLTCTIADKTEEEWARQSRSVREERNTKLTACDWTQLADSTADKAAWATYRQELRNVPAQTEFPWDVTWPTQP